MTPAPRRYIQLESELQAPISTRGTRPKIAAASRLAKEAGVDDSTPRAWFSAGCPPWRGPWGTATRMRQATGHPPTLP